MPLKECGELFDDIVKYISNVVGNPAPNQGILERKRDTDIKDREEFYYHREVEWKLENCIVLVRMNWYERDFGSFGVRVSFE